MKQLCLRSTITALVLVVLAAMAPAASANQVTWDLIGVIFGDGGSASGSFVYDANTNAVSSVNITTTTGISFVGAMYLDVNPGFGPSATEISFVPNASSTPTGSPVLDLLFLSALTNSGGTIALSALEGTCGDPGCSTAAIARGGTGAVTAAPEPSSLLLLATGIIALAIGAKRKLVRV